MCTLLTFYDYVDFLNISEAESVFLVGASSADHVVPSKRKIFDTLTTLGSGSVLTDCSPRIPEESLLSIGGSIRINPYVTSSWNATYLRSCSARPTAQTLHAGCCQVLPSLLDFRPEAHGLPPFTDAVAGAIPLDPVWRIAGTVVRGFGRGSKVGSLQSFIISLCHG